MRDEPACVQAAAGALARADSDRRIALSVLEFEDQGPQEKRPVSRTP